MSLSGASEDYWNASTRCTIKERCKFMFNNELLSDVKFVVRERGMVWYGILYLNQGTR